MCLAPLVLAITPGKREVSYSGNAKKGDALLEPALNKAARAGAPELDGG